MRTIIGVNEENIEKVWDRMVTLLKIMKTAQSTGKDEELDAASDIIAPMTWTMATLLDREHVDIVEEINQRLKVSNGYL